MKCPKCSTESGYVRSRKDEWVCRKCGTVTPLSKKTKVKMPKAVPKAKVASSKKKDVKASTKAKKKK